LLFSPALFAATLVVDDDMVQCPAAGYSTISAAVAAAAATDTIQVCDGTYTEGTIVVNKALTIDGINRDATIVNVASSGTFGFHIQSSDVTISDLVIQDAGGAVSGANGIRYESASALNNEVVSNVVFRDFLDGSARGIEVHDATMNDLTVQDSIFQNNLYGIRMSSNSDVDGFILSDNTFSAPANANDFTRIGVYQANDGQTSTFRDLQATGNSFTNFSLAGMFIEEIRDSTIDGNDFIGNYTGIILNKVNLNGGLAVSNVDITGNTFTNNTGRAIFLASTQVGLGAGVVIDGNFINVDVGTLLGPTNRGAITTNLGGALTHELLTISGNTFDFTGTFTTATTTWGVNLIGDGPVLITGNDFDGNDVVSTGTPPFAAIYITSNHATFGARNDAVTITCNEIVDFVHGITVYDAVGAAPGGLPPGVAVDVHTNNITGNSAYGIYNDGTSEVIDAELNWWGAADGPSGAGPGSGDAISANVDADPWLSGPQSNCIALSITKTDDPDPVTPGQTLTYTITVTNDGVGAADNVVVADTLPPTLTGVTTTGCAEDPNGGATCTLGTIAGNSSDSYTISGTVSPASPALLTNTASVSATGAPTDAYDDTAVAETTVNVAADLDLAKVLVTGGPYEVGDAITFRFDVTNNGPSDATGVVVSDPLPNGLQFVSSGCATEAGGTVTWNAGTVTSGSTVSCEFVVQITASGSFTNTATVTASSPADPDGAASGTVAFAVIAEIPVAGRTGLLLMIALLGVGGAWIMTRVRM
jgi:uncharacterized repeat protein (TIGR01451 family)